MKNKHYIFSALLFCICVANQADAAWTIKNGWIVDADEVAHYSPERHFDLGMAAMESTDWQEAVRQFRILTINFPRSAFGQEANYYLGAAYYRLKELDFANDAFNQYLTCHNNPQFFEQALAYKFAIANHFKSGEKKHCFGWKRLPKWSSAWSLAIDIYDEIIAAVPCHEFAAQSLFAKAAMIRDANEFRESIEIYQQLIRHFPKHELAPQSYLAISSIYLQQSAIEANNPDLLTLAQINFRRFQQDFPQYPNLSQVENDILSMREIYAQGLFETGQFYERKGKPAASIIYYQRAIERFPDTCVAQQCQRRMFYLTGESYQATYETTKTESDDQA